MKSLGIVVWTSLVFVAFTIAPLIPLFQPVNQNVAYAASESQLMVVLGMDEATGTRFLTVPSRRKWDFRGSMPREVPDLNNPCPYFRDYLVIGEVPTGISLSDDEVAKGLVEKGKGHAQRACPSFRISWNEPLKVNLYAEKYDKDKQPVVVAEWKLGMGQNEVAMEYRNHALEDKRGRRVDGDFVTFWVDKSSGAQFGVSQTYPWLIQHEPCLFNMSTKSLIGIVPGNVNWMDNSIAQALAKKGLEEFSAFCAKLRQRAAEEKGFRVYVSLYSGTVAPNNLQAYVVYMLDASAQASLAEYKNQAQERARQAEEQRRQAEAMARLQEQQKAEQARLAREQAEREAARQKRWNEFVRKNGVQEMINTDALRVNPFVYQGKTVAIHTHFERMLSPDTGKFGNIIVSGLPSDMFRSQGTVVLAGRVIGTTELKGRELGEPSQVPHLKFIGVHFCQDYSCSDLLK